MSSAAEVWGGADYELIAQRFAAIHDELVERLEPRPGERWLDVATGTGEVALRAARAGARVTAIDIAPRLLELARAKSSEVEWVEGDAQALPFHDASFDVVSSNFGVIFARDQEAAARELRRVCTSRLALTAWRPNEGLHAVYQRFLPDAREANPDEWGREERVEELLGADFELDLIEREWRLEGDSPEDVWQLMVRGAPPVKAAFEAMGESQRQEFRDAMVDYWRGFDSGGRVSEPRRYLLVLGRRR